MSEIEYRSIALEEIFDFNVTSNGSILTKTFVQKNKGNIPVYGSTMIESEVSYDYIKDNVEGIKYFDDCLTINRNGSAGYIFYRKGRFCINSDVTPLVLYEKYKGDDFDVLSVAVWDKPEDTVKGAQEHGIVWSQIINAQQIPTDLYGIEGIPHIMLVGPDGTIIKRDLRGEAIGAAVAEALGR